MLLQKELTNAQAELEKIKDETRKVHQMSRPVGGVLASACVLDTRGKPSTLVTAGTARRTGQDTYV